MCMSARRMTLGLISYIPGGGYRLRSLERTYLGIDSGPEGPSVPNLNPLEVGRL